MPPNSRCHWVQDMHSRNSRIVENEVKSNISLVEVASPNMFKQRISGGHRVIVGHNSTSLCKSKSIVFKQYGRRQRHDFAT